MYNIKIVQDISGIIELTQFKLSFSNKEASNNTSAAAWLNKPSLMTEHIEGYQNHIAFSLSRDPILSSPK